MSVGDVTTLVGLAEQFGPFLFAILFILVVTRTAHQWFREAVSRTPHANPAEIRTLRFYFILSVYCGIGAMILSVGWWFYAQTRGMYYYQFSISELSNEDQIISQFFSKTAPMPVVAGAAPLHDEYFLIGQPTPFNQGQKFTIQYYRLPQGTGTNTGTVITPQDIVVAYSGNSSDAFRLVAQAGEPPTLQLSSARPDASLHFLALRDLARLAQAAALTSADGIGATH
ncbi:MAG TPA: hypothetical protein VLX67_04650 [Stellaceae bacterium]|nr:hypothetical protein [Stellaceae bacterium]